MLLHSEGIVIKTTRYSETSVIAKIYTREKGMLSFYIPGVYSRKAQIRPSYLQPLQQLDLQFYFRENRNLNKIKEARVVKIDNLMSLDVKKSILTVFITEVVHKTVKEEEANKDLYGFLEEVPFILASKQTNAGYFPIWFLIAFSRYLGFFPENNYSAASLYFHLSEGRFSEHFKGYENCLDTEESLKFNQLLAMTETDTNIDIPDKFTINTLFDILLRYYGVHIPGFGKIRSREVLREMD